MHRALQGQQLLRAGLDPEMPQHGLIGRLLLAADDDDAHAADGQQRHRAELHVVAAVEGARGVEAAVAQALDLEGAVERLVPGHAGPGADAEGDFAPLPRLMGDRRGLRIVEIGEDGAFRMAAHQALQQADAIGVAAGAGIVLGVGEDDRQIGRVAPGPGIGDGLVRRPDPAGEGRFRRPHRGDQVRRRPVRGLLGFGIGDDGRAAFGDVGRGKAEGEGGAGDAAAGFRVGHLAVDALGRLDQRALPGQRYQEIGAPHRLLQRPAPDQAIEQRRRPFPGFREVDMGIGAADHQGRGMPHHPLGDVGMQIEADHDRQIRAEQATQALQELALAVLQMLGHHRAMEVEIKGIDASAAAQQVDHLAGDPLIGVAFHVRGRRCRTPEQRHQFMAGGGCPVDEAGDRQIDATKSGENLGTSRQPRPAVGLLEITVGRPHRGESIGFVLESADCYAGHGYPRLRRLCAMRISDFILIGDSGHCYNNAARIIK